MESSSRILCVGLVCLDIVNHLDHYPEEDEDIRAKHQTWQSGGNAANTAKVLTLIGRQCDFLGTIGKGLETDYAMAQLSCLGVGHEKCPIHAECKLPTSYVSLNVQNGSRTIIHYRNLPELTFSEFSQADIAMNYCWIHFEGRCPAEYSKMMGSIRKSDKCCLTVSVELEKRKLELLELVPHADVVIMSKEYAMFQGHADMVEAVKNFQTKVKKDAIVVCPWGEKGAAAIDKYGKVYSSPAYAPPQVMDTLGAGDTFNAALVHSLSSAQSLPEALQFACKVAGTKCGILGYDGLRTLRQL